MNLKHKIFKIVDDGHNYDFYDKAVVFFIFASIASLVVMSFDGIPLFVKNILWFFEIATAVFFTFDYFVRLWTADIKNIGKKHPYLSYVKSPMAIVDLLAILPFYISLIFPFLAILNFARVLRIIKLVRYSNNAEVIVKVIKNERKALLASLFIIFIILLFASTLIYIAEHEAQPDKYPDIVSSIWWSVVTLTTVGYGDVFPITILGKIVGGFLAITGIFVVAIPVGIMSGAFLEEYKKSTVKKKKYTPSIHKRRNK